MNGKFHDQIPVKIDTTNSKRKKPKHNQNSPKIILHENPSPKISYPKIPLSEVS